MVVVVDVVVIVVRNVNMRIQNERGFLLVVLAIVLTRDEMRSLQPVIRMTSSLEHSRREIFGMLDWKLFVEFVNLMCIRCVPDFQAIQNIIWN